MDPRVNVHQALLDKMWTILVHVLSAVLGFTSQVVASLLVPRALPVCMDQRLVLLD